ncbi:CD209 antigen-like protein E [Parambassis ranga]|uniref:CD209 antigen-like protein E n=1 Tax=Parambassis ranga TaxID=210632 RepID=A0A6P7HTY2_9TELE|nr:CD209 antigen-like protein E [Parambassis ranga]
MDRGQNAGSNFKGGFDTLICEEDLEEHPPYPQSTWQQVPFFSMTPERRCRLAAGFLALLAAVLLIVDIGLGVHYNKLTDTRLTVYDAELIGKELEELQDTFKAVVKNTTEARKQRDEMRTQKEVNWEFEHLTKMSTDYQQQIVKVTKDIATLRSQIPLIHGGCKHCSPGWFLMNSICYYFSFSSSDGLKSWQKAREFCQTHGGDLAIIDSKDKENAMVNQLITHEDLSKPLMGFWFGLRDTDEETTWKWIDGKHLAEAYWNDGEPNNVGEEDCAALYARENFFKAWNDAKCAVPMKWICEKAPTLTE